MLSLSPNPSVGSGKDWGQQRNGNYQNPVMPADFSDIDCIQTLKGLLRVFSTFQSSPGYDPIAFYRPG